MAVRIRKSRRPRPGFLVVAVALAGSSLVSLGGPASAGLNAPVSTITRPVHHGQYAYLDSLDVDAVPSGLSTVDAVQVSLKMKMKNGRCKAFNGTAFTVRDCTKPRWLDTVLDGSSWTYEMPSGFLFVPSDPNSYVKYYVVSSRAHDALGPMESAFDLGRNNNRFDMFGAP